MPFSLLLIALCAAFYYQQRHAAGRAGFPAPDFSLRDLDGHVRHLSDFRGKVVFLNLWATWCPPCRMEMPSMERLHQRLRGKDFVMLAVSEDETGAAAVQPFIQEMGLTFPVLLDTEGTLPSRYGVTGYPETFLIDRGGRVVHHTIGPEDWDSESVYRFLLQLLQQQPDTTGGSQQADN
ncbi:MAG TPA: TlpA disulfide reductase family protein [Candidatus Margulisiibacteriota bacterium]|nr:TlpA disulfide reductase family protein [Candidatus Margulisiibacteriota bacterium]